MRKGPEHLERRLRGALASLRATRTRVYLTIGHKNLGDSPHFSAELHEIHNRLQEECRVLARLQHKVVEHLLRLEALAKEGA